MYKRQIIGHVEKADGILYDNTVNVDISPEELKEIFGFKYKPKLSHIPAKISVTEMSKGFVPDDNSKPLIEFEKSGIIPEFLGGKSLTGAHRGTVLHRFLSEADYFRPAAEELKRLTDKGFFTAVEAESIDLDSIERLKKSELFTKITEADRVKREETFVVRINAAEYDSTVDRNLNETILLQGAIDVLCEYRDNLIIIDYKSDRRTVQELKDIYIKQLYYYKYAAEAVYEKPVSETYIYSFYNSCAVRINV